jgi:hypothetical protein
MAYESRLGDRTQRRIYYRHRYPRSGIEQLSRVGVGYAVDGFADVARRATSGT